MFFLAALLAAGPGPCAWRPQLQLVPVVSQVRSSSARGARVARARISFKLRTITRARAADDRGLQAHVAGYYVIARRVARLSRAQALGASDAIARSRLKTLVTTLSRDVNAEYVRQARAYDSITNNGRSQSQGPSFGFPGGPDAKVSCPQ